MRFNTHSELIGEHAFLSPSKFHWVNYTDDKLVESYLNYDAAKRGVRLHNFAAECILLGQRLPRSNKTLNMYVNDAIGYKMVPEQVLFYSENCFGTCDAISFKRNMLRIHDYKSGVTPANIKQLVVYAAIFCLEYRIKPMDIDMELRLYQSDQVIFHNPDVDEIVPVMDRIVTSDRIIRKIREREE